MKVHVAPMPEKFRKIPLRLRPGHPPVFTLRKKDEEPSPADRQLARELFQLLDEESKDWYGRYGLFEGL